MNYRNAAEEELEIEFNSGFDYVSEAFGATARDCLAMAEDDAAAEAGEYAAFIGPRLPFTADEEIPF